MRDEWSCDEFAATWDSRHLVGNPSRPFQLGLIESILRHHGSDGAISILEVGSGTGLVSELILSALPNATVDGLDNSPQMMRSAAERLCKHSARFRQLVADLTEFDDAVLNERQYDAIVILQVLHELSPQRKGDVLVRLRAHLREGGLMLYGERIRPDYSTFAAPLKALWETLCRWTPEVQQPSHEERVARVLAKEDHIVTLAQELGAFEEAGYHAEPLLVLGERCLLVAVPR